MALKRKLDKETYEKLSDEMKKLYTEKDGDYTIALEDSGDDDTAALRRAFEREKQEKKELKATLKELTDKLEEKDGIDAKKRGDIETLEKAWKEKADKIQKDYEARLSQKDAYISSTILDSAARSVVSDITTSPTILMPHVKSRLSVDLSGDEPTVRVLDAKGAVSAMSVDDLKKEFVANKDFSSIITASKASGGASKASGESQGGAFKTQNSSKPLAAMSPTELAAMLKQGKE